jgi:hypothetical protein
MKQPKAIPVVSNTEDGDDKPLTATMYERVKRQKDGGRLVSIFFAYIKSGEEQRVAA